jgi:hypothetical protein
MGLTSQAAASDRENPAAAIALDQTSIRWNHLIEDNLIYLNKLEQLVRVHPDAGCSSNEMEEYRWLF